MRYNADKEEAEAFVTPDYRTPRTAKNDTQIVFSTSQLETSYEQFLNLQAGLAGLGWDKFLTFHTSSPNKSKATRILIARLPVLSVYNEISKAFSAKLSQSTPRHYASYAGFNYWSDPAIVAFFTFHVQRGFVEGLPVKRYAFIADALGSVDLEKIPHAAACFPVETALQAFRLINDSLAVELEENNVEATSANIGDLLALKIARSIQVTLKSGPGTSFAPWFDFMRAGVPVTQTLLFTSALMNPHYSETKTLRVQPEEAADYTGLPVDWVLSLLDLS
jgi:hypothetical protein